MDPWCCGADIATVDPHSLVIGIPTLRRTRSLAVLLDSLYPQLLETPCRLIVADNDCGTEVPQLVAAFRARWPDSTVIGVAERGVVAVRNALLCEALARSPQWRWIAMLDDNCVACRDWLRQLVATGERFDAHIVGGPADGALPADASRLARNSVFAGRRHWPTGPVTTLNGTHNIAIARRTLALLGEPLFRAEYGASGGEDYELFRRAAGAGARLVWCEDAVVLKATPPERLTPRALLYRYASTGAYMAAIDRRYDGAPMAWLRAIKGAVGSALRLLAAGLMARRDAAARSVLALWHYGGRIGGLMGARTRRYAAPQRRLA